MGVPALDLHATLTEESWNARAALRTSCEPRVIEARDEMPTSHERGSHFRL